MKIVLASRSPQRKALLEALGVKFEVVEPAVEEGCHGEPRDVVLGNALAKARQVATRRTKALVIAGDTEVAIGGSALGHPEDEVDARRMLSTLSGRTHQVLGAVVVMDPRPEAEEGERSGVEESSVSFRELDPAITEAYLDSGEWRGRAGGYAIQGLGSALVERLEGDVSNVIGLPMRLLLNLAPELLRK